MRIGLDFDNTIIRFDDVFRNVAKQRGLLPADFFRIKSSRSGTPSGCSPMAS